MYETAIENATVTNLTATPAIGYEVVRFYDGGNYESLVNEILAKAKSVPAVYVRVPGFEAQALSTTGALINANYTLEVICTYPDHNKSGQIKTEPRQVNKVCNAVISKIAQAGSFAIAGAGNAYLRLVTVRDLFREGGIDARIMTWAVEGIAFAPAEFTL